MLRFTILGTLRAVTNTGTVDFTAARVKSVLAVLLLNCSRPVSTSAMIGEVWPGEPPRSAVSTIQTYIYQLRKCLTVSGCGNGDEIIVNDGRSYRMDIGEEQLDYRRFLTLYQQGRALLLADRAPEASEVLAEALALWRGTPLADVDLGPTLAAEAVRMAEQRESALRFRIEADLRIGRHIELIPELQFLVRTEPLHEWLHARLLAALSRAGRRADALRTYRDARQLLADELGLGPSQELEQLHQQVLIGEAV